MTRFANVRHEDLTNAEYHGRPADSVSNSRLKVFARTATAGMTCTTRTLSNRRPAIGTRRR